MFVDADSQCNLTLSVIGQDEYENFVTQQPDNNIKSGLAAAFESKPQLINPLACVNIKDKNDLYLLPGSFEITEYEVQLGVSFQLTHSFTTMKNLPGAFSYLIRKTAEELGSEIVLIDLNPSLSAINQILIVSSDYFILPTSPDYFSEMAIKSIARVLPKWEAWAKQARTLFEDATYPLPVKTPKFLGYTVNDFTVHNKKPSRAFQNVIDKIDVTVRDILVPNLKQVGMLLSADAYNRYCLAEIPNFHSFQARYQEYGIPVFELTDEMIGSKKITFENQKIRKAKFESLFSDAATEILRLIDYAESH